MKVVVTGSSGCVGRAVCILLGIDHEVVGVDRVPSSTTDIVCSIEDTARLRRALQGAHAVVHTAALHAPHVGHVADTAFEAVNVRATEALAYAAIEAGVQSFVFTSTTALYGSASTPPGRAGWVDENTPPTPRSVYHRSKLEAECRLQALCLAHGSQGPQGLAVTVLRMSRCFPEPAPVMAAYRLHRGIDVRDVADAHALALLTPKPGFRRFVISGQTPFQEADAEQLACDAPQVIAQRAPELATAFSQRGWALPSSIDRVYVARRAMHALGWRPRHGFDEVLAQLDRRSSEVLPPRAVWTADE
jgi:UDP-glucose 4-epimerase